MSIKMCPEQERAHEVKEFREWRKWHPEESSKWIRENPEEYKELLKVSPEAALREPILKYKNLRLLD